MKIKILTLFPEMYKSFLDCSIIKRAISKKIVSIELINFREYTKDKYGRVDTPPIGGGAGLILKCQPILDCLKKNSNKKTYKIILSPRGEKYNQKIAKELSLKDEILILCGHYEGYDERIYEHFDESISIGDYILTGGETASFCVLDSIIRLLPGAISNESIIEESFENDLLEYPQYTEPYNYKNKKVPDILYSGNHNAIAKYRKLESLKLTKKYRNDLFSKHNLSKDEIKLLNDKEQKWKKEAIEKGKKFIKNH